MQGAAAYVALARTMIEQAPDARMRIEHMRVSTRAVLGQGGWYGTRDGGSFEIAVTVVFELGSDGTAVRYDVYDVEQVDAAWARFEAIPAAAVAGGAHPLAAIATPNAATAALERWRTAFGTRDWDALRALFAPDGRFEDRRRQFLLSGNAEWMISSLRDAVGAVPDLQAEVRLVGTAGARVDIERVLWFGGSPDARSEVEYLAVSEVDAAGRVTASISFDPDDDSAAKREAWTRWAAIDPAAPTAVSVLQDFVDAFNDRDRVRCRACFVDDLVVEDRRRTGAGRSEGAEAYVEGVEALLKLAPVQRAEAGSIWQAYARHGGITTVRRTGTLADGGAFENEYLMLFTTARGRLSRLEYFEVDDVDEAKARLEELRPSASGIGQE
jgi:hypothetical protein